ncbi:hypothetical protein, partial [Trinickia sp. Y13]|uniref:hypothetical protein n=1 Tax=Trinickia sp. Y13 TaxID=2917807 RepID=UPI0024054722
MKIHLSRLVELEYVIAHRGRNGVFEYELLYSGEDDGRAHLCGLLDPTALADDGTRSGSSDDRSGSGRAVARKVILSHFAQSKSEPPFSTVSLFCAKAGDAPEGTVDANPC